MDMGIGSRLQVTRSRERWSTKWSGELSTYPQEQPPPSPYSIPRSRRLNWTRKGGLTTNGIHLNLSLRSSSPTGPPHYSAPTDRTLGVIADQTVALDGVRTKQHYPDRLRRIRYKDPQSDKTLVFLTNRTGLDALTVCNLYKSRWQVELFFKWVKQHLRVKRFLESRRTRSSRNCGSPSRSMCWLQSSASALKSTLRSTQCYRFSPSCRLNKSHYMKHLR